MSIPKNMIENNTLTQMTQQAGPRVFNAIRDAAAKTGVNFAYLLEKAAAESNFDADAKAKTSSASGLFQFIESTWMSMVKKHGHKYGLGEYADKISDNGKVEDAEVRKEILSLRNDPEKASFMAAEFASENARYLRSHVKGDIGATELYFAHFMGAGGATSFLNEMHENPMQNAADLFPKAARANRNVFYDAKTGQPRTLAGVYEFFDRKFGDGKVDVPAPAQTSIASASSINAYALNEGRERAMLQLAGSQARAVRIFRDDEPRMAGTMPVFNNRGAVRVDPVQLMMMAELDLPSQARR